MRTAMLLRFGLGLWVLLIDAGIRTSALSRIPSGPVTDPSPTATRVLRGRVLLPDAGSPLGLRAYLTTPSHVDSTDVDATGAFVFNLARAGCDSLDIRIAAADVARSRYYPASLRIGMPVGGDAGAGDRIRVLLVPRSVTIEGGSYAGTVVPIDIDAALPLVLERSRYWRIARSKTAYGVPIGWREEDFPLPLAATGRAGPLIGADSAALWAIVRQLERDFGRTLFRPVPTDSTTRVAWSVTVSLNPDERTPGITFITYDGRADVFEAEVAIRSSALLSDARVITHELLHVLGFGHSVGWYSVMGSPFQAASRATASDIAYAQLLYRLRRIQREQGATHGVLASYRILQPILAVSADRCSSRADESSNGKS